MRTGTTSCTRPVCRKINLETGGLSAESETGGVAMNVIPKDGGNTIKPDGAINGTNGDLEATTSQTN